MTIHVYNTLTRKKEPFEPVVPGKVGMYVCGPTVYSKSHIGHMVGPIIFDAIKRYLAYNGYSVTFVVNITDIDDKIIVQAAKEKCGVEELSERVTKDYFENLQKLGVHVDHFPRATKHIPEIIEMISTLMKKGYAYAIGGDVYFDVTRDADYGKLSNRKIEELLAGTRKEVSDLKRNAVDFALWKGAKPGEPAWDSPWGPGRPGWHIECSAMSMKLLGKTFDIHGGGLDLCFPHHEDEIAQSESYSDQPFAKYWLHNGLMQYSNQTRKIGAREGDFASQEEAKMSKSKGNIVTISDLLSKHAPETVRFFLLSTHYRRPIDFSDERIEEVNKGLARWHKFGERFEQITGKSFYELAAPTKRGPLPAIPGGGDFVEELVKLRERFLECMDDDFNTGGAIGVLFEMLPALNRFIDANRLDQAGNADASKTQLLIHGATILRELTGILGVLEQAPASSGTENSLVPALLDFLVELRQDARKNKNFAMSDSIRNRLKDLGIVIEDRADGSSWKIL
ncbi:MAG: cysteine--tRNA ligase [Planctomycetota bacterium]